jgi:hypothetical protein
MRRKIASIDCSSLVRLVIRLSWQRIGGNEVGFLAIGGARAFFQLQLTFFDSQLRQHTVNFLLNR